MSTVQHKILSYEVAPPQGVWEKIAAELDESELSQNFPSKLKSYEVVPPEVSWQAIAASLSAAELTGNYAERLNKAEVTPPAAAWTNIKIALDAEHEAAVPERRRFSPLLKYAAAAAVIGLIAFGTVQIINNGKRSGTGIAKAGPVVNPPADIQPADSDVAKTDVATRGPDITTATAGPQTALAEEKRNDAALEASKKTFAMLDMPATNRRLKKIAAGYHFASAAGTADLSNETAGNNFHPARYITVMTPDCNLVRISKKLEHLSCCVSGEVVDKNCKQQLDKWRKQIASSPAGHPASFMDIMDLVDALGDE